MHKLTEFATAMFPKINTNHNSTFYKKMKIHIWHFLKMHEFATFLKLLFCKFTKQHELLKFGNTTYARF